MAEEQTLEVTIQNIVFQSDQGERLLQRQIATIACGRLFPAAEL